MQGVGESLEDRVDHQLKTNTSFQLEPFLMQEIKSLDHKMKHAKMIYTPKIMKDLEGICLLTVEKAKAQFGKN